MSQIAPSCSELLYWIKLTMGAPQTRPEFPSHLPRGIFAYSSRLTHFHRDRLRNKSTHFIYTTRQVCQFLIHCISKLLCSKVTERCCWRTIQAEKCCRKLLNLYRDKNVLKNTDSLDCANWSTLSLKCERRMSRTHHARATQGASRRILSGFVSKGVFDSCNIRVIGRVDEL